MATSNDIGPHDNQSVAVNAILTVPDSDQSSISDFLSYVDENRFSPIARMCGLPVYRLNDIETNNHCYMSNERSNVKPSGFVADKFALFGEYIVFSGTSTLADGELESYLVSQDIVNIALLRIGKVELTPAEVRLTVQLLSGLVLKMAANQDNVSVETKRSQLKSVLHKLDVGRQQDIMLILLPELVRITDPQSWDGDGQRLFNLYAGKYLPTSVRCQSLTDRQGRSVRIVDYGPLRGQPVLILHSMIFPDITEQDVAFAVQHNLRIIVPLRPGILETSPTHKPVHQYAEDTLHGIELAWIHMCGEPVEVIAMVSSAWHAVAFAQANPEKVRSISFAATCFSAGKYENSLVYFGSSVAELCSRNVWLMTKTVDFIRSNVNELARFRTTISRIFKNSKPDMEILDSEFEGPNNGRRLMMAMLESPESVKHDYFNQVNFHWPSIESIEAPVRFVHGAKDSIHKLTDVEKLIRGIGNAPLVVFKSAGHIMQYEHFHQLLSVCLLLDDVEVPK